MFVSPRGSDRAGDGGVEHPFRTVGRAVAALPSVIDRRYSIVLMPGVYSGPVDLSAKLGSVGLSSYATSAGRAPKSFVAIRARRPGTVVIDGHGRWSCVVARQITVLVAGLTCRDPAPVGIDISQGSGMVDDVTVSGPAIAGIAVEHGQLFLGGDVRVVIVGDQAIGVSVRGASAAREGTLLNPDVRLKTRGGRIGVFVRDRSAFSVVGLRGDRNELAVDAAYFGVNVQEGSSFFAGKGVTVAVAGAHDAFIAQALSGIDAGNVRIERTTTGAHATKRSVVVLDIVSESAIADRVDSDKSSSVIVD
ncbi:MAG: hypothetical protein WAP37_08230 [Solirubrobacterales bacterium]